jgi:hypothetical protein
MVALAFGIATARMFPTIKYAMGYGHACQRIRVDGADLIPGRHLHGEAVTA